MEIIENKENKLLGRKEIVAKLANTGATPKRADIKASIAKVLKVDGDLVIVNEVSNSFGDSNIKIKAKVYDSKEVLEQNARPHMVKRNTTEVVAEEASE